MKSNESKESKIQEYLKQVESIGESNQKLFETYKELVVTIEDLSRKILKFSFSEEEINLLYEGKEVKRNYMIKEYQKNKDSIDNWAESFEKVINNHFVADSFFFFQGKTFEDYNLDRLEESFELREKRRRLEDSQYEEITHLEDTREEIFNESSKIEEEIRKNNKAIGEIEKKVFQAIGRRTEVVNIQGENEEVDLIDTTNLNDNFTLKIFETFQNARQEVAEIGNILNIFERSFLQLKVFFDSELLDDDFCFSFRIRREANYTEKFLQLIRKKDDILQDMEKFQPIKTDKFTSFNDKVTNTLPKIKNKDKTEIAVIKESNNAREQLVNIILETSDSSQMKTSTPLNQFDIRVLQHIYTITRKNLYFDIQMLKESLTGGNANRHRNKLDEDIEKSIEKLSSTYITIEIPLETQEGMFKGNEKIKKNWENSYKNENNEDIYEINQHIISLTKQTIQRRRNKKINVRKMYSLNNEPLYFVYAVATGQMQTKDIKLLEGGISTPSQESCILTDYLSTQIHNMQYNKGKKTENLNNIRKEGIFEILDFSEEKMRKEGIKDTTIRTRKRKILILARTILNEYVRIKEIKSYTEKEESFNIRLIEKKEA